MVIKHEERPVLTIVTVVRNAVSSIRETVESVLSQTYGDIEYIVVDGDSDDGTSEILSEYSEKIEQWICEEDNGIADAMEKGLQTARGRYVMYLNADDYLIDAHALERIVPHLLEAPILSANIVKKWRNGKRESISPRGFNWWFNFKIGIGFHQSAICDRTALLELGGFDSRYEIAMDYDLFMRAFRAGLALKRVSNPVVVMSGEGVSSRKDRKSLEKRLEEEKSVHFKYCPNNAMRIVYKLYWYLYPRYKLYGKI